MRVRQSECRAGWTTDGECGFDELSGSPPTSIRQQAMRGLAKIALQRGQRDLAKAQYERILGKALMGRGQPAEHWAHAEYAWLHFEDGHLAVGTLVPSNSVCLGNTGGRCPRLSVTTCVSKRPLSELVWL